MKIKFLLFTALLLMFAMGSCKDDDDSQEKKKDDPTLSVEPSTAIAFSAAATESHTISVTTNQAAWDAKSDKDWCIVTKANGKFTVTAMPNTAPTAPAAATITITAGEATPVKINVSQSGLGAELTVSPTTPISFTATPQTSEAVVINVATNQASWDAVSDQNWCVITKEGNKFTVMASQNLTTSAQTATITVSAGNAANVAITVTQAAANTTPGDDKVIWDDTHWRMLQLRGKPKSVVASENYEYDEMLEFNSNGMLTYNGDRTRGYYLKREYDAQGRCVKMTDYYKSEIEDVIELEYGNHTKYLKLSLDNERPFGFAILHKGLTAVKVTNPYDHEDSWYIEYDVKETSATLKKASGGITESTFTYSGNYPTSWKIVGKGENENIVTRITTFKYNKDFKYAEVRSPNDIYTFTNIENPSYMLVAEHLDIDDADYKKVYEYDKDGMLTKMTQSGPASDVLTYSNYQFDTKGNWIQRTFSRKSSGSSEPYITTQTRTITYY